MGATRRHIVHVTDSLGVNGGAEQQLVANLRGFDKNRFRHSLVCLKFADGMTRADLVPAHVDLQFLFQGSTPGRLGITRRLDEVVAGMDADLLHCSVANASLSTRLVGWRRSIPVVESLVNISHDPVRMVDNPNIRRWKLTAHQLVDRVTMRRVARFHALTDAVADSWVERVGLDRRRIRVIPRGVDAAAFANVSHDVARAKLIDEFGIDPDAVIVLNVGRQVAQKGQRYLIEAMVKVRAHANAELIIAGSPGTQSRDLVDLIEAIGGGRVHLIGPRRDIADMMAGADVFAFPSLFEGLGVSLLEAMASRLATVVSDVAPMNRIVEDGVTGVLVPAGDGGAIADELIRLANDRDERARLGAAARRHVEQHYRIDAATDAIEDLYGEVLER
jgi:glycosyltransferase involved in cell wall biosynthesis